MLCGNILTRVMGAAEQPSTGENKPVPAPQTETTREATDRSLVGRFIARPAVNKGAYIQLRAELTAARPEFEQLVEQTDAEGASWVKHGRDLLERAETNLRRGEIEEAWRALHTARRFEVYGLEAFAGQTATAGERSELQIRAGIVHEEALATFDELSDDYARSTLFLFFVESRLSAPGWEGPLLVLFFLAAAASAPIWGALARRFGARPVLLAAMALAVISFGFTLMLGAGDTVPFALICIASGATIGADLTLLPAMFARRMAAIAPNAGQGFGLWSLVSKFTLALAAAVLLPLLEWTGFRAGSEAQPEAALTMLTVLYALVPSLLKLVAIALLAATQLEEKP